MLTEKEEMAVRIEVLVKLRLAMNLVTEAKNDLERLLEEDGESLEVALEALARQEDILDPGEDTDL